MRKTVFHLQNNMLELLTQLKFQPIPTVAHTFNVPVQPNAYRCEFIALLVVNYYISVCATVQEHFHGCVVPTVSTPIRKTFILLEKGIVIDNRERYCHTLHPLPLTYLFGTLNKRNGSYVIKLVPSERRHAQRVRACCACVGVSSCAQQRIDHAWAPIDAR